MSEKGKNIVGFAFDNRKCQKARYDNLMIYSEQGFSNKRVSMTYSVIYLSIHY